MIFEKMHGLGNDFIVVDNFDGHLFNLDGLAIRMCDRHTGVGADGVLYVERPTRDDAVIQMRIFNADGSEADMCGNGMRCFAKYVHSHGLVNGTRFAVETGAGIVVPEIIGDLVRVNMGKPSFLCADIPVDCGSDTFIKKDIAVSDGMAFTATAVLMGVPHLIVESPVEPTDDYLTKYGRLLECHYRFPKGTNVDFTTLIDKTHIAVRTWERGCGITLACGTGCCAAVVACHALGLTENKVSVKLTLGVLDIEVTDDAVFMTGPALTAFVGEFCE